MRYSHSRSEKIDKVLLLLFKRLHRQDFPLYLPKFIQAHSIFIENSTDTHMCVFMYKKIENAIFENVKTQRDDDICDGALYYTKS